jgi:branched-chain amino acid transport system permease protein
MGIDVDRAHRIAFALGVSITAIAGGLLAVNYPFHPYVGLEYVVIMYAGVVLGGLGSIIFVVFLLIVFFMPQGFFGRVVERT